MVVKNAEGGGGESLAERLSRQFYDWEVRGRGWQVWDAPVELEPQFAPFFGHYDPNGFLAVDDGRRPRLWAALSRLLLSGSLGGCEAPEDRTPADSASEESAEPIWLEPGGEASEIQAALPAGATVSRDAAEQLLVSLGRLSRPAAFEIVATEHAIRPQFACGASEMACLHDQLRAFFPDAALAAPTDALEEQWFRVENAVAGIVEFGLSAEFLRPLRRFAKFDPDPLTGLIGAMSSLVEGEVAVYQVLFMPAVNPWAESILRAATDGRGGPFFVDDPSMLPLAGEKVAAPLFGVVVRMAMRARTRERVLRVLQRMAAALRPFADPRSNELLPLTNGGYDAFDQQGDMLRRQSRRSGMLLNADELVSLAHLPSASVRAAKLLRAVRKTKAAPDLAEGFAFALGVNDHAGRSMRITQSEPQRLRHTHVIGASGTGKSTLLLNMILQDIERGEGVAVLDPHGDLIDELLGLVPDQRVEDVVLLDPSDAEHPVGLNILAAHSELERNLLASDLVSVFRRLSTSWGDQMTVVLSNAILAFLESTEGGSLSDLRRFLVEPPFRKAFLETVADPEVLYYWQREYPLLRGNPHAPILTRLNTFLRPKMIRNIVTQRAQCLDVFALMNDRKILLAKLAQGLIGEENAYLLGALLVSKINQAATGRQQLRASDRMPFFLYVDEFHNFVTPSMAAILSGARKYGLGLILAHQELEQISGQDRAVASAVISNPYTRICFRVGDSDAKRLAEGFAFFAAQDLLNLGVGEAICRMERAEYDFNLRTAPARRIDNKLAIERRERVVASSRRRCAVQSPPKAAEPFAAQPAISLAKKIEPGREAGETSPAPPREPILLAKAPPPVHPASGRGGRQHQYLQELVKRWAESHGYRATIEKAILNGLGSVDVALERPGFTVACEISITTSAEHEVQNVTKCLAAGYDCVVVLGTRGEALKKIAAAMAPLEESERVRVRCFQPDEFFAFLEERRVAQSEPQTVRGYKVRVTRKPVAAAQEEAKRRVITEAILHSMRRLKAD